MNFVIFCLIGGVMAGKDNSLFAWDKMWKSSYYQILNIDEISSTKEIKKAYRKLAITLHPDKLQLHTPEDKMKAEQNFVRLAKAYEILSDEKIKRKRYDYLLRYEGIVEYPDDLNYQWDWIDQKVGILSQSHRSSGPQEKNRQSWTYEEAKEFFKEASKEDEWSWEKDTTLRDIQENPVAFVAIIAVLGLVLYFPSLLKTLTQSSKSKTPRETVLQKVKHSQNNSSEKEALKNQGGNLQTKSVRNIRLKRKELVQLLIDYLEELLLYCSKAQSLPINDEPDEPTEFPSLELIRAEVEEKNTETFSQDELEHFCFQLKDHDIVDSYIEIFEPFSLQDGKGHASEDDLRDAKLQIDLPGALDLIEHLTLIIEDHRSRRAKGTRENQTNMLGEETDEGQEFVDRETSDTDVSNDCQVKPQRVWTTKEISVLAKGVQKYPGGTRQRWEIITNFMNHQLAPQGLYTKEECLEQYQTLRANKGGKSSVPSRSPDPQPTPPANGIRNTSIPKASHQDETKGEKVEENWSHEQQKQLENGLLTYPSSCGLSQSDRWKAIAELVEDKTAADCLRRYKQIRESIKSKQTKKSSSSQRHQE